MGSYKKSRRYVQRFMELYDKTYYKIIFKEEEMTFIESIKERAKKEIKTIVLPEAEDLRVLEAASKVTNQGFAKIILLGSREKIEKTCKENTGRKAWICYLSY